MSSVQAPAQKTDERLANTNGRHPAKPRRRRRGWTIAAVVVVLAAATAAVTVVWVDPFGNRDTETTIDSGTSTGLAKITRGELSARSVEAGTLGFAGEYKLINKVSGTYTQLPKVGDVIKSGKTLYKVDGKPVILLKGAPVPVYRELSWGTEGADVRQLNTALVELGYADSDDLDPKSDEFGRQTYNALSDLEDAVGLEEDGVLELGEAIFVPSGAIRVTEVSGGLGGSAASGQAVLEASSTGRVVRVDLRASRQSNVAVGDEVLITLPGNKTTPGKVTSVGKVASEDQDGNVTVEVLITPTKPKETGVLDQAPVSVAIVSETVENVLSVPANALLALAGGGYAVEAVDAAGAHSLIGVTTGLFDDSAGRVEVSGKGLAEGQNVVVPAS
jgi:hypothetical protein